MPSRITCWVTALFMIACMLVAMPAKANAQSANNWIDLGMSGAQLISNFDGSATAGNCAGQLVTFSGTPLAKLSSKQSINGLNVCLDSANKLAATDRDGTLYVIANSTAPNDFNTRLLAFNKDGSLRWNADPPSTSVTKLVIGADGNLYGTSSSTTGSEQYVFGYSNLESSSPTLALNKKIVNNSEKSIADLAVYANGLIVQYFDANVEYFSYSGDVISSVTVPNSWYLAEFNAGLGGQIFVPVKTTSTVNACPSQGTPITDSINAYGSAGAIWTFKLAACTTIKVIRPTPDGGAVALMSSDDGLTKKYNITYITADGKQRWQLDLPGAGSTTNFFSTVSSVTTNGDIVLANTYTQSDNNLGVVVSLVNGATGSVTNLVDLAPTATDGGHTLSTNNSSAIALTNGRLYFVAAGCQYSTNGGKPDCYANNAKLYAVDNDNLTMDYPRGAVAQTITARKYYALGDSFASGEGAAPFVDGTDIEGKNTCHRSLQAYATLLQQNAALRLVTPDGGFVACSGAETKNVRTPDDYSSLTVEQQEALFFNNEDLQINNLRPDADLVTLSIGGNDIGFSQFVSLCLFVNCAKHSKEFQAKVSNLDLQTTYNQILQKAPNATIYVIGYPQLLPKSGCSKPGMQAADAAAKVLYSYLKSSGAPNRQLALDFQSWMRTNQHVEISYSEALTFVKKPKVTFSNAEVKAARKLVTKLDAQIKAQVAAANAAGANGRLVYVDPTAADSPFTGHELCTDTPYFNGLTIDVAAAPGLNVEYSFHPNQLGISEGYYRLLLPYFSK
ncbi:MAG: SGNH/GDSL hydrolase family protein [Candidatus Woesebacteria bacterium]|jgi:hypothetical protein